MMTKTEAGKLLREVGVCLRYQASDKLPLASMYEAVAATGKRGETEADAQRRATVVTNALIEDGTAVEITCVADRVCLAHASLVPALIRLCRRAAGEAMLDVADLPLSDSARRVLDFLDTTPRPTAGQVRSFLGVPPKTWPNAADEALGELQRLLVIDRGATDVPATGAAYLSRDGIPYRLVDVAHRKHVAAAHKLDVQAAAAAVLGTYVAGARTADIKAGPEPGRFSVRKLRSVFKRCMTPADVDAALERLGAQRKLVRSGDRIVAR